MLSKKQIDSAKQVEQVEIINLVNSKKLAFCLQMFCKMVGHKPQQYKLSSKSRNTKLRKSTECTKYEIIHIQG